jgi:cytochrome c biogenesis protein CcdA
MKPEGVNFNLGMPEKKHTSWKVALGLLLPMLAVVAALFVLVSYRDGIEAGVANLALLLPFGYAFGAGMVASVNPCGVLLLPSFAFSQLKGRDEQEGAARSSQLLKSLLRAGMVTLGFVVVFLSVGLLLSLGGRWLTGAFKTLGLLIGAAMVILGLVLLLTQRELGIPALRRLRITPKPTNWNAFLFGIVYAVSSLSCSLPIFLVVVGTSLAGEDLLNSAGQFVGYSLGMGVVVVAVVLGAAFFRQAMLRWLDRAAGHVQRFSALFVLGAGAYLIYYWLVDSGLL